MGEQNANTNIQSLSEISDASCDVAVTAEKKPGNRKRALIVVGIIVALVLIFIVSYCIYWHYQYDKYAKPIIDNPRLTVTTDDDGSVWGMYDDSQNVITYSAGVGKFPAYDCVVDVSLVTGTLIDEDFSLLTDHTILVTISRSLDGTLEYTASIEEIAPAEETSDDLYRCLSVSYMTFKPDGSYVEGKTYDYVNNTEYDSSEDKFNKYKDEIFTHVDELYAFFGKENLDS